MRSVFNILSTERPFKTKSLAENKLTNSPFFYLNLRQQICCTFLLRVMSSLRYVMLAPLVTVRKKISMGQTNNVKRNLNYKRMSKILKLPNRK